MTLADDPAVATGVITAGTGGPNQNVSVRLASAYATAITRTALTTVAATRSPASGRKNASGSRFSSVSRAFWENLVKIEEYSGLSIYIRRSLGNGSRQ